MATRGTAAEFVELLSQATPLAVLILANKRCSNIVDRNIALAAEGLDYSQALLNVIGNKSSINPVMNAVADAFNRRKFAGTFRYGGQSVELDTLLHESSSVPEDSDNKVAQREYTKSRTGNWGSNQLCFLFQ